MEDMSEIENIEQDNLEETPVPVKSRVDRLSDLDRMAVELSKSRRQTALEQAKTALANSEKAELAFKNAVLQIYMKYGLTEADTIAEDGSIQYGGAIQQQGK